MSELRLGDCFAGMRELADGSVGHIITDPPYDPRTHAVALERKRPGPGRAIGAPLPFAALSKEQIGELGYEFGRIAQRWILVFCADRMLEDWAVSLELGGARVVRFGMAVRTNPRPQMTGDRPAPPADWIVIAHGKSSPMRWNGGGKPARWNMGAARFDEGGQLHPTQKPLDLMRQLIEDFTDRGELVCDPFAGSGTTAIAAKSAGRCFLGWEINPAYHAIAIRRLNSTREQLGLAK